MSNTIKHENLVVGQQVRIIDKESEYYGQKAHITIVKYAVVVQFTTRDCDKNKFSMHTIDYFSPKPAKAYSDFFEVIEEDEDQKGGEAE